VCLSAPELARQMMGDTLLLEAGGGALIPGAKPGGRSSLERSRVSFRSLPACLKVARRSSLHVLHHLYQGAWAQAGSPLIETAWRPGRPPIAPPFSDRTFSLFERPPPTA
jgi:hypothetical protein